MADDSDARAPRRILMAACGSIYVTQLPSYLVRIRQQVTDEVKVVMTSTAARILPPATVAQYCAGHVYTDGWSTSEEGVALHVGLARWADTLLVLPATGNMIGKVANGIADDLLSTIVMARAAPVAFAPAMNLAMWRSAALKRNLSALEADGHKVILPSRGIAIGSPREDGEGVTPEPKAVLDFLRLGHRS